jgi:hypothetical protein
MEGGISFNGVVKILHLRRCTPRALPSGRCQFLSLRRTLVRRNDKNFARLAYEVFYLAIRNFRFLRVCQRLQADIYASVLLSPPVNGCKTKHAIIRRRVQKDYYLHFLQYLHVKQG